MCWTRRIILLCTIAVYILMLAETKTIPVNYDQDVDAASHHHGRVHMKVFRGPTTHDHHFAPHGYWIKQPADNHHHHH